MSRSSLQFDLPKRKRTSSVGTTRSTTVLCIEGKESDRTSLFFHRFELPEKGERLSASTHSRLILTPTNFHSDYFVISTMCASLGAPFILLVEIYLPNSLVNYFLILIYLLSSRFEFHWRLLIKFFDIKSECIYKNHPPNLQLLELPVLLVEVQLVHEG